MFKCVKQVQNKQIRYHVYPHINILTDLIYNNKFLLKWYGQNMIPNYDNNEKH